MDLYLRKVIHPQAGDSYRVILKDDGLEIEIGSIGIQHGSGATEYWAWAIDTVVAHRALWEKDAQRQLSWHAGMLNRRFSYEQASARPWTKQSAISERGACSEGGA